jgi:hypothetical protein
MICATLPGIRSIPENAAGLETRSGAPPPMRNSRCRKNLVEIKKEPNRKAVAAPRGGPHRVLLPFLAEDLVSLYH